MSGDGVAQEYFDLVLPRLLDASTWTETHHPNDEKRTWQYRHTAEAPFVYGHTTYTYLREIAHQCFLGVRRCGHTITFVGHSAKRSEPQLVVLSILFGRSGGDTFELRRHAARAKLCPPPRRACAQCARVVSSQDELTEHRGDWWCDRCALRALDHGDEHGT
jgi:hypothetical protein